MSANLREDIIRSMNVLNAIQVYVNLSDEHKADREIAMCAVSFDGLALAHAPLCIKSDPEVAQRAITNTALARLHAIVSPAEATA
jgi:hypothetical protein